MEKGHLSLPSLNTLVSLLESLLELVVGVEVMLPEGRELPLHDKCCLIHLSPVHLTLYESVSQSVGLIFQLVNFLPQQTVLIFQPL